MDNKIETCEVPIAKMGFHWPLIFLAVGSVLCGSENTGVKAIGAGITTASFLSLLNKLSKIAD